MSMTEPAPARATAPLAEPLPPRTRLLHIGIPKSGTTYMQRAAATRREELLAHGVRYPGQATSHRLPILALMGEEVGWGGVEVSPDMQRWARLMSEVEAERERRIYLSNEVASLSNDEQAARFADALGPDMHVLITLRGYTSLLASNWQQRVKTGSQLSFDRWLTNVLAEDDVTNGDAKRLDYSVVVERWIRVAGAERVTVIIADKARPSLLTDALSDLLGIPRDVLDVSGAAGYSANRSMSLPEVEMVRALNAIVRRQGRSNWAQYSMLVRNGATARMLQMRSPGRNEPGVVLPAWAAERAEPRARAHRDAVAASGCRIIGDLDALCAPVPTVAEFRKTRSVPIEAAAEALAGAVSAATGRRAFFGVDPEAAMGPEADQRPAEALGRMRGGGGGGKVWIGPAVSLTTMPTGVVAGGTLPKVIGRKRAKRVNHAYAATKHIPTGRLLAVALLRPVRRRRRS